MKFHAFMYVTIGRRRELEQGMAGKNPVLYQRVLIRYYFDYAVARI